MLLYKNFPDFVEILNFYGWIMLVIPLILPLWRRLPVWAGLGITIGVWLLGQLLAAYWDFFGSTALKAILVEDKKYFCYGVLTRGPMAFLGIFIGDLLGRAKDFHLRRKHLIIGCTALGIVMLILFVGMYYASFPKLLVALAKNKGKHPPSTPFTLFSVGGSFVIIGLCFLITKKGPWILKPFEILGRESLICFNWHICFIFIGLRWAFALKRFKGPKVTYEQALLLTLLVTVTCIGVAMLNTVRKRRKRSKQVAQEKRRKAEIEEEKRILTGMSQ